MRTAKRGQKSSFLLAQEQSGRWLRRIETEQTRKGKNSVFRLVYHQFYLEESELLEANTCKQSRLSYVSIEL